MASSNGNVPDNLAHVLKGECEDPDCELHHPGVGLDEETVTETDFAFFLAGAQATRDYVNAGMEPDEAFDLIVKEESR